MGDLLEKPDDLYDCEFETRTDVFAVPVVSDVLVSPSSVVTECWDGVSLGSAWEFVEPQSFSLSKKRSVVLEEKSRRDDLRRDASESASDDQKRMMPPTPHSRARTR